jgi:polysaccharide chain length determinant protein (PEP-CTERM system associated)
MIKEGKRRIVLLSSILAIVSLAALALGIILPKRYDATALLAVELGASAKLVEGRTTTTKTPDLTPVILQFTDGKKIIREILLFGGWVEPPPAKQLDPREEEQLINKVRGRIKIDTSKEGFVRIAFHDNDPDRVYRVVNKLAEIFIREAMEAQLRDAREALKFIDDQVKEYGGKLATVHQQVIAHYRGIEQNLDLPKPAPAGQPQNAPRPNVDVAALRAEKAQLEAQLARKTNISMPDPSAENAARARVAQLQAELDRLRTAYTEEHPDVKRVKRELAAATEELRNLEAARKAREADAARAAALDEELRAAWRARLEAIDKRLAAATGMPVPPPTTGSAANKDKDKENPDIKGIGQDTTLAELVRQYEATRDVYQDLLKRRETARVTLDLVTQDRGFTIRVQEPAEKPVAATGLRLSHFCIVGILLGCLLPVAILFAIVRFDRRVRSAHQIEAFARVPLLVSITPTRASGPSPTQRHRTRLAIALVVGVFVIYLATFIIKTRA